MLILCDFDGTITDHDVTNLLWDRYYRPDWREILIPQVQAGRLDSVSIMAEGYRHVRATEQELLAYARTRAQLREGFEEFTRLCTERGWPLQVLSCGLDWYLRDFLPAGVEFHALETSYAGGWQV